MYKQTLWLLISLILDFSSFAQNQEKLNFFPINTDAINTENYDFLKKELEDKRIVCLGEQVHMDGSSIAARAKLIEYLVNELHYEVILTETGIYNTQVAFNKARQYQNVDSLKITMYKFWQSVQFQPIYDLIQKNINNIEVDGFDCKISSKSAYKSYPYSNFLQQKFESTDNRLLEDKHAKEYLSKIKLIEKELSSDKSNGLSFKMTRKEKIKFNELSKRVNQIIKNLGDAELAQIQYTLDNSILNYSDYSKLKKIFNKKWLNNFNGRRDELMASNLEYLISQKHKEKKIIVIGANFHFLRNPGLIEPAEMLNGLNLHESKIMMNLMYEKFKQEIYTVCFTTFTGSYGIIRGKESEVYKIGTRNHEYLEYHLSKLGHSQIFLPLETNKNNNLFKNRIAVSFTDYISKLTSSSWSDNFDAIYFIYTMEPIKINPTLNK